MEPKIDGILLQEAYFGKQKELIQIENLFNILRKNLSPKQQYDLSKVKAILKSKELEKIERLFAQLFGFNEVFIEIIDLGGQYNLFATPKLPAKYAEKIFNKGELVSTKEVYDSIKLTNRGYFIDKSRFPLDIYIGICIPAFFDKNLTDEELTAAILHEIGHHLYDIISKSKIENIGKLITGNIHQNPITMNDEQFSDKVAAMYGYSAPLASFLNKAGVKSLANNASIALFTFQKENIKKSDGILRIVYTIIEIDVGMIFLFALFVLKDILGFLNLLVMNIPILNKLLAVTGFVGDPHPAVPHRLINNINYMEKELKKAKVNNPRLAKNIQNEINETKKIMMNAINGKYSFDSEDDELLSHKIMAYYAVLQAVSPISIISNVTFRIISTLFTIDKGERELEEKSRNKGYFNLY